MITTVLFFITTPFGKVPYMELIEIIETERLENKEIVYLSTNRKKCILFAKFAGATAILVKMAKGSHLQIIREIQEYLNKWAIKPKIYLDEGSIYAIINYSNDYELKTNCFLKESLSSILKKVNYEKYIQLINEYKPQIQQSAKHKNSNKTEEQLPHYAVNARSYKKKIFELKKIYKNTNTSNANVNSKK